MVTEKFHPSSKSAFLATPLNFLPFFSICLCSPGLAYHLVNNSFATSLLKHSKLAAAPSRKNDEISEYTI